MEDVLTKLKSLLIEALYFLLSVIKFIIKGTLRSDQIPYETTEAIKAV